MTVTIRYTYDKILATVEQETITIKTFSGLTGPKGDTGDTGPIGPTGPQGEPGTSVAYIADIGDTWVLTGKGVTLANMETPNTNLVYTVSKTDPAEGTIVQVLGNWASEPTIAGSTKIAGSVFAPGVNMYLFSWYNGFRLEYWFEEI